MLQLGEEATLVACPVCAAGQEPFSRLFIGRRVDAAGNTVPVSTLCLPNDLKSQAGVERLYNEVSLKDFQEHFSTTHPYGVYEVSARRVRASSCNSSRAVYASIWGHGVAAHA